MLGRGLSLGPRPLATLCPTSCSTAAHCRRGVTETQTARGLQWPVGCQVVGGRSLLKVLAQGQGPLQWPELAQWMEQGHGEGPACPDRGALCARPFAVWGVRCHLPHSFLWRRRSELGLAHKQACFCRGIQHALHIYTSSCHFHMPLGISPS